MCKQVGPVNTGIFDKYVKITFCDVNKGEF